MLTQSDADYLMALEKYRIDEGRYSFPLPGKGLSVDLNSADRQEKFLLDINRRSIQVHKVAYQNRARINIPLIRLDFGVGHRNPDGAEIGDPHIHVFREGDAMRWAMHPPSDRFRDLSDRRQTMEDFFAFCHIVMPPYIEDVLL